MESRRDRLLGTLAATVSLVIVTAALGASASTLQRSDEAVLQEHYRDAAGWSLDYPPDMSLETSSGQSRASVSEATVATFAPRTAVQSGANFLQVDPPLDASGAFPPDAVALRIVSQEGGPPPDLAVPETRLPVRLEDFGAESGLSGDPAPLVHLVVADGHTYRAYAYIGREASPARRAALAAVVGSLAFPPLRVGSLVGQGFSVLPPLARFPARFTRVQAQGQPFYLVRSPGGLYALGWRWQSIVGGYKSRCRLALDRRHREFFCTNMRARWDRVGRVLVRPRNARLDDPLNLAIAKPAWDGHVLLAPGSGGFADARLARALWPKWRP